MDKESDDTVLMLKACEQAEDKFNTTENTSNCIPVVLDNDKTKETNKLCSSSTLDKIDIKEKYTVLKVKHDTNKETLRKLKLVKHHKKKNDLTTLDKLIKKWQLVSQNVLLELIHLSCKKPSPTMLELIHYFCIDPKMVGFDPKTEEFVSNKAASSE